MGRAGLIRLPLHFPKIDPIYAPSVAWPVHRNTVYEFFFYLVHNAIRLALFLGRYRYLGQSGDHIRLL